MNLVLFAVRGSGAEVFARWVCDHLDDYDYSEAVILPDGRVVQITRPKRKGEASNVITLIQDPPPGAVTRPGINGAERLTLVNSPVTTFATRATRSPLTHNVDPIAVAAWKELVKQDYLDLEQFFADAVYRRTIADRLKLHVSDRAPTLGMDNKLYSFHSFVSSDLAWVFDKQVKNLARRFRTPLRVPDHASERTPLSFWYEAHKHYANGNFDKALDCYKRSSDSPEKERNLALTYRALRQFDKAEAIYKATDLEKRPEMRFDYFCHLQTIGRIEESWQHHEARFESWQPSIALERTLGPSKRTRRYDKNLENQTLLVAAEGGCGDELQYARWISTIKELKRCRITLACQPALMDFFKHVGIADRVVSKFTIDDRYSWSVEKNKDYWHPLMSSPMWLDDYSIPDPVIEFNEKIDFKSDKLKVGICWQGNLSHAEDGFRSCSPEFFKPLSELENVDLVNLQHEETPPFPCLTPEIKNFVDLARVVNSCDLVVSVDSAPAHLAGVLGKPTFLLLSWKPSYQWGIEGKRTHWYSTHTLLRQKKMNDWESVIQECCKRINGLMVQGKTPDRISG